MTALKPDCSDVLETMPETRSCDAALVVRHVSPTSSIVRLWSVPGEA